MEHWRDIPLTRVIHSTSLRWNLSKAGYHTAGSIVDATAEELARNVYTLGPVRAQRLRRSVIDKVCPPTVLTQQELRPADGTLEQSNFWDDLLVNVVGTLLALLIAALLLAIAP
jgi:hypothetical protein